LAKPNYQYEKRQKELAKKAKKEEKRLQKLKDVPKADSPDPVPGTDATRPDGAGQ
jgi:hypothetical protein